LFWEINKMMNTTAKTLRMLLIASVAGTIFLPVAHANDLAELKTLFESFKTRDVVNQAALQAPEGFRVFPAADAPAEGGAESVDEPFTEVKVSGYLKGGYIFSKIKDGSPPDSSSDFDAEAGVNVRGSVQSSLGEVGVSINARWEVAESTTNAASTSLRDDGIVAFWQFADTMKFEMGRGNAGRLDNGILKNTRRIWTTADRRVRAENAGNGFFDRDAYNAFLGLAYADGPIAITLRAHDATRGVTGPLGSDDDSHGASGKAVYTADLINLEVAGGYWDQGNAKNLPIANQTGVKWLAGAGTELNFITGLPISISGQTGRLHNGAKTLNGSTSIGFTLTDDISAGIGAGWKKVSGSPTLADNRTERAIVGGVYYAPMAQLIIGLEGDWLDDGKPAATENDGFTSAFVARFSF
jgi:hypothetical protein